MGSNDEFFQTVRGVVGITGGTLSKGPWEHIANDNDRYSRSMKKDPVLPPSLFVSDRDRVRHGLPTPVVERCLEDVGNPEAMKVGDWDIADINPETGS